LTILREKESGTSTEAMGKTMSATVTAKASADASRIAAATKGRSIANAYAA
jgi:hypothetical protein